MEWRIKTFSELSSRELYDILRMRSEIFVVEQRCVYNDVDGADLSSWQLFSYGGGRLAASMRILRPGAVYDTPAMGRIAVAPDFRRCGAARAMMERALDFAEEEFGGRAVTLAAQLYLTAFYRSLGFHEISEPYDDCGILHVDMRLEPGARRALKEE